MSLMNSIMRRILTRYRQRHGTAAAAVAVAALLDHVRLTGLREGVGDPRAKLAAADGLRHLDSRAVHQTQVVHVSRVRAAVARAGAQHHGVAWASANRNVDRGALGRVSGARRECR